MIQNYVQDMNTLEIRAWDPATGGFTDAPKTKYYASAGSIAAIVSLAALGVAGFTWLIIEDVYAYKTPVAETELVKARTEVERDPNLTEEQKARILEKPSGSPWPATMGVTFASVALIVIVLFVWSWRRV